MNERTRKLMFSSERQDWATPQNFFDELNKEFHFTLDPCCTEETAKCRKFFTKNKWTKAPFPSMLCILK